MKPRERGVPLTGEERAALLLLIESGVLLPVQVFGSEDCCEHNPHGASDAPPCPSQGHGLCDRFSIHTPAGSDCNRAEWWLMRPVDEAMDDPALRAAWMSVLQE